MIGKFCLRNSIRWLGCWIARMGLHVRPAISVGIVLGLLSFPVSAQALLSFVEVQQDGVGGVDGLDYAYSVTVSPDGKNLYAAGAIDDAVAVFSRNTTTGELSFVEVQQDGVGGVDGLDGARSMTVSPDGKNLYAAGGIDNAVAVFSRDTTTGELSFVEVQMDGVGGVDGLDGADSVTVSPDGKNLYAAGVTDDAVAVFSRNTTTGELSFVEVQMDGVGGVDGLDGADSVTVSPDGKNLYAAGIIDDAVAVFSRNTTTGELSFVEVQMDGVGGVDGLDGADSVTVSPDGKNLYAAGGSDDAVAVFSRNTTTGELSFVEVQMDGVGGVDGLDYARSVTVSPDGKNLYAAGAIDNAVTVFGINLPGNAMPWIPLLLLED
jgi:6-phosphogluconolactonase (cycloisomerase 2 family)